MYLLYSILYMYILCIHYVLNSKFYILYMLQILTSILLVPSLCTIFYISLYSMLYMYILYLCYVLNSKFYILHILTCIFRIFGRKFLGKSTDDNVRFVTVRDRSSLINVPFFWQSGIDTMDFFGHQTNTISSLFTLPCKRTRRYRSHVIPTFSHYDPRSFLTKVPLKND